MKILFLQTFYFCNEMMSFNKQSNLKTDFIEVHFCCDIGFFFTLSND